MRPISKEPPPPALAAYRVGKDCSWDALTPEDKQTFRCALVREQRGLCAYCMSRIAADAESTKIEHILPRRHKPGLFDWNNLVACCDGREGYTPPDQTCDTKKGDTALVALNVLAPQRIGYVFASGRILSKRADVDDDLNHVLNLNAEQLRRNRQRALDAAVNHLKRAVGEHGIWRRGRLLKALDDLRAQNPLQPYVGVIECYLERKIARK